MVVSRVQQLNQKAIAEARARQANKTAQTVGNTRYVSVNPSTGRELNNKELEEVRAKAQEAAKQAAKWKSREQIMEEANKIRTSGAGNARTRNKNAVLYEERQWNNQQYRYDEAFKSTYEKMLRERESQLKKELKKEALSKEETKRAEQAAAIQARAAERGKQRQAFNELKPATQRKSSALDKETRNTLNYLEAQARSEIARNQADTSGFQSYLDFDDLVGEGDMEQIMSVARDTVDDFFTAQENEIRARLALNLKKLNENFNLYSKESEYLLEQAIEALDRDTAETLTQNVEDAQKRGTLDSGLLMQAANKIIEAHERSEGFERKTREFSDLKTLLARDLGIEEAQLGSQEALSEIDRSRRTAEQDRFFQLMQLEAMKQFNAQKEGASRYTEPTGYDFKPAARSTDTLGLPSAEIKAPTGSSLDLARRAASGEISLDQQRSLREDLLMGRTTATPVTSTARQAATPTPTLNRTARNILKPATISKGISRVGTSYTKPSRR